MDSRVHRTLYFLCVSYQSSLSPQTEVCVGASYGLHMCWRTWSRECMWAYKRCTWAILTHQFDTKNLLEKERQPIKEMKRWNITCDQISCAYVYLWIGTLISPLIAYIIHSVFHNLILGKIISHFGWKQNTKPQFKDISCIVMFVSNFKTFPI